MSKALHTSLPHPHPLHYATMKAVLLLHGFLVVALNQPIAQDDSREQIRANPGEVAQVLKRFFNSVRVLANRRHRQ